MKRLLLTCALCFHCLLHATTLPPIELAKLFGDADVVALVQITSGEVIGSGETACGAKYSALVVEGLKGTATGSSIEFGNYFGYEVGNHYVLFLIGPSRKHEPMMSANSMHLEARAKHEERCGSRLKRHTVMHSGNGALKVHWVADFKYKDGVAVPTRYVVLPMGTESVPAKVTEVNEFSGEVWVRLPDLVEALRGMRK